MMRVTTAMISNQVVHNLSRSISRFYDLQNQMSTNRRINKPSDDPMGTVKALSYRERLSNITQYMDNISMAQVRLQTAESALNDINDIISAASEIAVQMSNDTYDATARAAAANDVQAHIDRLLEAINMQLHGDYIFSGYRTTTASITKAQLGGVYQGDSGVIQYTIDTGARLQVNVSGAELLTKPFRILGEDSDLNLGVSASTTLASLNGGAGVDLTVGTFEVTDANLGVNATINLVTIPPATTIGEALNKINVQLAAAGIDNLTAVVGDEGNNIRLVAQDDATAPTVSLTTALSNLHGGTGVDMETGRFLIHTADDSINVAIELNGAETLQDVKDAIETQLTAAGVNNIAVDINAAGNGLQITDGNGTPLDLIVEEAGTTGTTATDLGIVGSVGALLLGSDLTPRPAFTISESGPGQTTAADLGLVGSMNYNLIGSDLNPQLLATAELAKLGNGLGMDLGEFVIAQGTNAVTINPTAAGLTTVQDLLDRINSTGLSITASINAAGTGIQISNDDPERTLLVKSNDSSDAAGVLGLAGSTDVLGNVILLAEALRDNNRELVEQMVGPLNDALNEILDQRAAIGAKVVRAEVTLNRLQESEVNYTRLLSEVEDADLTKLITDLAMQENAYTAALQAAAKIIQPSLLDFIG
ncbi:MAG: flagellar hook-associated protein FlgL [bacterium]